MDIKIWKTNLAEEFFNDSKLAYSSFTGNSGNVSSEQSKDYSYELTVEAWVHKFSNWSYDTGI